MTAIEPAEAGAPTDFEAIVAAGTAVELVAEDDDLSGIPADVVEVNLPPNSLQVCFNAKVVDAEGVPPTNIISTDDDFYVVWDIWVRGPLWRLICGCWCVDLRIESIGPDPEFTLSSAIGNQHGCGFRHCFHGCRHRHFCYRVCVPRHTIPTDKCSSLYLFAATFQLLDHCGDPAPIVGYKELGVYSFYEPGNHH